MGTFDKNPILESIETLCGNAVPKVSFSKMCVDLGLSKSLKTKLKDNPQKTINGETAQKIADYFGVSVDRVLGYEQKETPTSAAGEQIPFADRREALASAGIHIYLDADAKLTEDQLEDILDFIEFQQRKHGR